MFHLVSIMHLSQKEHYLQPEGNGIHVKGFIEYHLWYVVFIRQS